VAQGVGAGAIPAVAYTAVGRSIPAELRPRVFAVFSSAWVIPGLMGPAAAAAITAAVGWRGVFLGLLPLVVLAALMTVPALDSGRELQTHDGGDRRPLALALVLGVAALLVALGGGVPPWAVLALAAAGIAVAAASFLRLVPPGTVRLAPGMPAAVMVRGLLTFAFFGADAYVSLTYADVRGEPIWVAGLALTAATLLWTTGAWIQQRLVHTLGPRRLVAAGFAGVALGIVGLAGGLGAAPLWPSVAV
jgi:MFS family permease